MEKGDYKRGKVIKLRVQDGRKTMSRMGGIERNNMKDRRSGKHKM